MPLIAVQQILKEKHLQAEFMLAGTDSGLEKDFAKKYNLFYVRIPSGKLRRYFSWANFFAPFLVLFGFLKALYVVHKFNPDLIFGAGGFVSVPIMFAAFVLRKKILVHQQDLQPSLTNKIVAPLADNITVSFESSLKDFNFKSGLFQSPESDKIIWTGNPVRKEILYQFSDQEKSEIKNKYGIVLYRPVVLILGGATGAASLNDIILKTLPGLISFADVIHSTGKGKTINFSSQHYKQFEIIENMPEMYAIADIVVTRAGLSTLSELSVLGKVAIVVPMPESHQLYNASMLADAHAAVVLNQSGLSSEQMLLTIRKLLYDANWQAELKENISKLMPKNAAQRIAEIAEKICNQKS